MECCVTAVAVLFNHCNESEGINNNQNVSLREIADRKNQRSDAPPANPQFGLGIGGCVGVCAGLGAGIQLDELWQGAVQLYDELGGN